MQTMMSKTNVSMNVIFFSSNKDNLAGKLKKKKHTHILSWGRVGIGKEILFNYNIQKFFFLS